MPRLRLKYFAIGRTFEQKRRVGKPPIAPFIVTFVVPVMPETAGSALELG